MAHKFQLEVDMREATGTSVAKKLRRQGIVPGVIYGGGQSTYPVQMNEKSITDLLKSASSENVLVDLKVRGTENPDKLALIQSVQHHTLSGRINHIDFQAVREDELIRASVPIRLTGSAAGEKQGGLLEHQLHELDVQCLPKDLPELLTCDVSHLELGKALHVEDVVMPEGVAPLAGPKVVVALVVEPKALKAEEAGEIPAGAAAAEAESSEEGS
jgi:large subunit ribosomal protein L25